MKNYNFLFLYILFFALVSCSKDKNEPETPIDSTPKELTIFCVNDVHGQIDNFAKIKHIIDQERESTNVLVVSGGDLFSGNPVVDNHPEKGYPMIDLMNRIGFDAAVLGNHEFDYGVDFLKKRMIQSNFDWICANVDMQNSSIPEPYEYKTITKENIKITLLGLVETNGKEDGTIPSTHPWRVAQFHFDRPEDIVSLYSSVKSEEKSDLYIALTHLGLNGNDVILGDIQLANKFPFFDLIIGGHSHSKENTQANGIPIFQAGSYLNYLGKISVTIQNKKIESISDELIDLNTYKEYDSELKTIIDEYNNQKYLTDVIGYSNRYHDSGMVGCFYTDALRIQMNVDVCFQNTGGIRSGLNEGDITKREIYEISPFNNGTVIYEMTVLDIKKFLRGSGSGFYYSGIQIQQMDQDIEIRNMQGQTLANETTLRLGLNDYIPAVYDKYFPGNGEIQNMTDAETIISFLLNTKDQVEYPVCNRYFRMH
ncbi:bifunctional metallophosphatase/5'-nucleotidase [Labilibaculum antarcticum]|uniref:Bifunctional metallophosphatase/5'-nucleotidase n=1 Tax=Labilibaculum antarcticum TaxID=1717717 RepID=A0A1Y1CEX6_9BACT|nr:bifunctional UDP-sugar hydrolase/5'-nucleotidase [Labilibaculum antarcticum]BAX78916.1 hypothetical protein ALGA_0523 [Labilibaculum antarcticum]